MPSIVAIVAALALVAGVLGYVAAPDAAPAVPPTASMTSPSATASEDLDSLPLAGAVITVTPGPPTEAGPRAYRVAVVADGQVESVILRAGRQEVDSFRPDGVVSALRVDLHTDSTAAVDAVTTLADGRSITSLPVKSTPPPDTVAAAGATEVRAWRHPVDAPTQQLAKTEALEAGRAPVEWAGPGELHGGVLTIHDEGVSRVFFYITDDGKVWDRVPATNGSSIPLTDGMADLTGQLPSLEGRELQLEIWRMDPEDVAMLGVATATVSPDHDLAEVAVEIGLVGRVDLHIVTGAGDDEQLVQRAWFDQEEWGPIELAWSTDVPGVTHIVWQAFDHPPDEVAVPTDTGAARVGVATASNDGRFSFMPPGGPPEQAMAAGVMTGQDALVYKAFLPGYGTDVADTPQRASTDDVLVLAGGAGAAVSRSWYFRAFAFVGDAWAGFTSPDASAHLGKAPQLKALPSQSDYSLRVEVVPPNALASQYRYCYEVTNVDVSAQQAYLDERAAADDWDNWNAAREDAMFLAALMDVHGTRLCADRCYTGLTGALFEHASGSDYLEGVLVLLSFNGTLGDYPPGCDSSGGGSGFVGGLLGSFANVGSTIFVLAKYGYTFVEETYNEVKAEAVGALAKYSGCEALGGGDLCQQVADYAVTAALASVGLPPNLPSADAVIAGAKGDVAAALAEAAKSVPGVGDACEGLDVASKVTDVSTCEEIAAQYVDAVVEAAGEIARHNARIEYGLPFVPGTSVIPDSRGNTQPLRIRVTATLEQAGKQSAPACEVNLAAGIGWEAAAPLGTVVAIPDRPWGYHPTDVGWSLNAGTYVAPYRSDTITLSLPAPGETQAAVHALLMPPSGPSGVTAWRSVTGSTVLGPPGSTSLFIDDPGAPENRLWLQTWELPDDVLVMREGATLTVLATSHCAGSDLVVVPIGSSSASVAGPQPEQWVGGTDG